jgi:hypothetical protein
MWPLERVSNPSLPHCLGKEKSQVGPGWQLDQSLVPSSGLTYSMPNTYGTNTYFPLSYPREGEASETAPEAGPSQ